MAELEPSLLIHLRGTGEEGFTMPPLTAQATALGLQLPAARLLEETHFQKRRAAVIVGPAGCGKSHWLARFARQLANQRPVLRLHADAALPQPPQANTAVLIDGWDTATETQHTRCREWLEPLLRQHPDVDAVLLTNSDTRAMQLPPATWLEFQWAPPSRRALESALADWELPRTQALLRCLDDPCLAMLARRPAFWSAWPQNPARDNTQLRTWAQQLAADETSPAAQSEYRQLLECWQQPPREMQWIDLPGGACQVGSPEDEPGRWGDEGPQKTINLQPFSITHTPVTNAQFKAGATADSEPPPWWGDLRYARPNQPVTGLSQPQAAAFAAACQSALPSETQWEYACRGETRGARYAENPADIGWYALNSEFQLRDVAGLQPNSLGLYDMLGNTWEWAADHCHDSHANSPADGSAWHEPGSDCYMLRGGTWADRERVIRSATRLKGHPGPRVANTGFRLSRI